MFQLSLLRNLKRFCLATYTAVLLTSISLLISLPISSQAHTENSFKALIFSKDQIPKAMTYKGKVSSGLRWSDKQGENYVIFSESRPVHGDWFLYVNYYRVSKGVTKRIRLLRDKERCGELDNVSELVEKSIALTDLDHDGDGEVTFVYGMGCGEGVGNTAKLMLLEDKNKYAIRGSMSLDDRRMNFKTKGEMKLGTQLKKLGEPFLNYAIEVWKKYTHLVYEKE